MERENKRMDKISKTQNGSFEKSKHKSLIKAAKQKGLCSAKRVWHIWFMLVDLTIVRQLFLP